MENLKCSELLIKTKNQNQCRHCEEELFAMLTSRKTRNKKHKKESNIHFYQKRIHTSPLHDQITRNIFRN